MALYKFIIIVIIIISDLGGKLPKLWGQTFV